MSKNRITYEVKKVLAELSNTKSGYKKVVKLVSWNNAEPKIDIREWTPDNTPAKGIALNEDEAKNLFDGLTKYYRKQRKNGWKVLALTQAQLKNYDYGYEDNQDITITAFAKRLMSLKEKTMPGIITYNDLVSWLVYRGDLTGITINEKERVIPTRYGNENGFYLAKKMNSLGIPYVGLFMNKDAQEYAIFFYDEFLRFVTTPVTMDRILKDQELYSQEL